MKPSRFRNLILDMPLSDNQLQAARLFFEQYDLQEAVGPTPELSYLGDPDLHTCRYCGRCPPEVTFKTLAHLLPDFMGNRTLASYFECDNCNNLFSLYEGTFANYFGISRTISQILSKSGKVPRYEDLKQGFEVSVGATAMQLAFTTGKKPFTIDKEKRTLTIKTTRLGYVPLHLVKLLWKVGIALLPGDEVADFAWVRELLLSTAYDNSVKGDPRLQVYLQFLPGPPMYPEPYAQLFTRRVQHTLPVLEKQVVLYYANYVIQVALPSRLDTPRLFDQQVHVPIFPNIVTLLRQEKYGQAQFSVLDFSDAKKKKNEPHVLSFSIEQYTKMPLSKRNTIWVRRWPRSSNDG